MDELTPLDARESLYIGGELDRINYPSSYGLDHDHFPPRQPSPTESTKLVNPYLSHSDDWSDRRTSHDSQRTVRSVSSERETNTTMAATAAHDFVR